MRIRDWSSDVCSSVLDQGQGFELGAGVFGLALGPQPRHPGVYVLLDLVAPAGGQFGQFHAAFGTVGLQRFERLRDAAFGRRLVEREQGVQLNRGQRLVGGEQGSLRSEEHTSELQSLMRISYAVFCLKKKTKR